MALILKCKGISPVLKNPSFLAPNATILGDVEMDENCNVWFNAVIRGDVNSIRIGKNCNIQDGAVIHCTYEYSKTVIEDNVSIGHNALVHGCTIRNNVLIGMGAIVMDKVIVEPYCIIGAGAIVLENTICESGFIYAGNPARKIKAINDKQRLLLEELPQRYILYGSWIEL